MFMPQRFQLGQREMPQGLVGCCQVHGSPRDTVDRRLAGPCVSWLHKEPTCVPASAIVYCDCPPDWPSGVDLNLDKFSLSTEELQGCTARDSDDSGRCLCPSSLALL